MNKQLSNRFVSIGSDHVITQNSIIGIFDLDSITVKKDSRSFINMAQKKGEIKDITTDLPITVILCSEKEKKQMLYLSSFSLPTIHGRIRRKFP
ncbi:MAG: DUF370 domain-containing protein [Clostridia bacterium]|nr:DUF370 domain-containing protein [Clostridia bacterium]